jgi:outer membrane immunogenic protein
MKAVLIASSIGFALVTGSASAADLVPLKTPPPPFSWTGCYIDGGVGYGMWNQDHYVETSGLVAESETTTDGGRGWLGRAGAGCDYQVSPSIVVGAFGDYDWMGLNGISNLDLSSTPTPFFGITGNEKETSAWSAGARIGYLVTPRLLTYIDGGYTRTNFGQVSYTNDATVGGVVVGAATGLSMPATTYNGWFLGGGTEYALNMPWIPIQGLFWRNEYRFDSYSSRDIGLLCAGGGATCGTAGPEGVLVHADNFVQTITTGVVWKFNFGGPGLW